MTPPSLNLAKPCNHCEFGGGREVIPAGNFPPRSRGPSTSSDPGPPAQERRGTHQETLGAVTTRELSPSHEPTCSKSPSPRL